MQKHTAEPHGGGGVVEKLCKNIFKCVKILRSRHALSSACFPTVFAELSCKKSGWAEAWEMAWRQTLGAVRSQGDIFSFS